MISHHLKFKLKIQTTVRNNNLHLLLKALYLEATLTFLRFATKYYSISY